MRIDRRAALALGLGGLTTFARQSRAATEGPLGDALKIGILTDESSVFSDGTGKGGVVSANMTAEDFGGNVNGTPIVILSADHQNKPDVGANIAREWFPEVGRILPATGVMLEAMRDDCRLNALLATTDIKNARAGGSSAFPAALWVAYR